MIPILLLLLPLHASPAELREAIEAPPPGTRPDWVASAPGAGDYPDADGLWLRRYTAIRLLPDGRSELEHLEAIEVFTDYLTWHDVLDPRIDWNDAQELELLQVRSYLRDGTPVDAAANSFVDNTPAALQWAVPYAATQHEKVVVHVGVEEGGTSVLAYRLRDREPRGPLWGELVVDAAQPVLDERLAIEAPGLRVCGVGIDVPEPRDGSWELSLSDLPGYDASQLQGRLGLRRVVYSTASSWEEVRRFIEQRVDAALQTSGALDARAQELIEGVLDPYERVERLHRFVVEDLKTVDWPPAARDYAARPAAEVLDSSAGDALDKAVLLAALLRSAGFRAELALVSDGAGTCEGAPAPQQLPEFWVHVLEPELWLDPTASLDERNAATLAGRAYLPLDGTASGLQRFPEARPDDNRALLRVQLRVEQAEDALALSGHADLDLYGSYAPWWALDRERDPSGLAGQLASALGGAQVDAARVVRAAPGLLSLSVDFSGGSLPLHGGVAELPVPRIPGGVGPASLEAYRPGRDLPLALSPGRELLSVSYELGDGLAFPGVAEGWSRRVELPGLEWRLAPAGDALELRSELRVPGPVLEPEDWPAFRAALLGREQPGPLVELAGD